MIIGEGFRDGVIPPGATAQCVGGVQAVLERAATAGGTGLVAYNPGDLRLEGSILNLLPIGGVHGDAVSLTDLIQIVLGLFHRFFPGVIGVQGNDREHLLHAEGIVNAICLHRQNSCSVRNRDAALFHDQDSILAHHIPVHHAVGEQEVPDDSGFLSGYHIGPAPVDHLQSAVIVPTIEMDGLFASADDAVVKAAAGDDLRDGCLQVISLIDQNLHITCTHTQGWLAGGVDRAHHVHTAGGDNHIHRCGQHLGQIQGFDVKDLDAVIRSPQRLEVGIHVLHRLDAASHGAGMGGNNDGVSAFQGEHRVGHAGDNGVGGGGNRTYYPHGLSHLSNPAGLVHVDDPHGFFSLERPPDHPRLTPVLGHLVLVNAHPSFFDSIPGQLLRMVEYRFSTVLYQSVHLFLRIRFQCSQGRPRFHQFVL